jgi:Holliday junction resolvase RusA-like endonuclease
MVKNGYQLSQSVRGHQEFLDNRGQEAMIQIIVYGNPAPQGSKKFVGHAKSGRGIMIESSAKNKPWREAVKHAALAVMESRELSIEHAMGCNGALLGPVIAEMVFTVPKPKSAPKSRRTYPDRKPDLSKLIRSTEDALSDAGVWEDDARVIEYRFTSKVYPNEGTGALHIPGAIIRLWSATEMGGSNDAL